MTDTTRTGLVHDLEEAAYHVGPELSVSGAKDLLHAPALYKHNRANPVHKDAFDLGTVTHTLVLGTGWDYVVIDADDWRGKAARETREQARAEGKTALLRRDFQTAENMAQAVLDHRYAGAVFASDGRPEVSWFWEDERTGIPCRARADWLHPAAIVDLKTARDASPDGFAKAAANLSYCMQAHAYRVGYEAVTGNPAPPFLFVAVDNTAPHLVSVTQLDEGFLDIGRRRWDDALDIYAACTATDSWPGYPEGVVTISAPRWAA